MGDTSLLLSPLEKAVVDRLKSEKIKLWLEPYVSSTETMAALAAAVAAQLEEAPEAIRVVLEGAQGRALAKLRAKRTITVSVGDVAVALDRATSGREARVALTSAVNVGPDARIVVQGRGLVDDRTLEDQGWPVDVSRCRPLRALVIPRTMTPESLGGRRRQGSSATAREESVLARAARRVARDVELRDLHGRSDPSFSSSSSNSDLDSVKADVVAGVALHARGRAMLDASGGDAAACAEAVPFLIDADEAFGRVPFELADKLDNVGLLQLDICRAYAFVEDPTALSDAAERLQRAERALARRFDPRYVDAALGAARATTTTSSRNNGKEKKIPPDLVALARLKLLKGVFLKASGTSGWAPHLDDARALLRALNVSALETEPLQLLGATRLEAVAAIRKAEGNLDRAATLYLEARAAPPPSHSTFLGGPSRRPRRKANNKILSSSSATTHLTGGTLSAQALDHLRRLAPHRDLADCATALRRSGDDVNRALDFLLLNTNNSTEHTTSSLNDDDEMTDRPATTTPAQDDDDDDQDDDDDSDDEEYEEARALLQRELGGAAQGMDAAAVDGASLDLEELLLARWTT
eukprot:CAMPEP_0118917554 /NCGR_PEP_ID=MMETSP1166-20130328/17392_1 /TAXON_ID=1104430 /ORGANISM="Chrysoreinhardia sp, Strain CCMP3193" /LENGTH=583 /DNA_ID=CAMNT_0006857743 /DNA_START=98 /DNA_END=1849 /DNA_ORIENTATION=+